MKCNTAAEDRETLLEVRTTDLNVLPQFGHAVIVSLCHFSNILALNASMSCASVGSWPVSSSIGLSGNALGFGLATSAAIHFFSQAVM